MLPIVLMFVGLSFLMRHMNKGGGVMGIGKSKAKAYVQKETGVTFKDVAGQDEAKESLQEVVVSFITLPNIRRSVRSCQRRPVGGTARYRKDTSGQGGGRGGPCALLFSFPEMDYWFGELHTANVKTCIRVERQLYSGTSDFQRIDVFDSPEFGRFRPRTAASSSRKKTSSPTTK